MADTDGSVAITIDMDVSDAEKELASLKSKVRKLETELSEKKYTRSAIEKQLEQAEQAYKDLYNSTKGDLRTEAEVQAIQEAEAHVENLKKKLDKVNDDILTGNIALDAAKNRYAEVTKEAERLRQAEAQEATDGDAQTDAGAEETIKKSDKVKQKLKDLAIHVKNSFGNVAKSGFSALGEGIRRLPGLFKSAFSKGLQLVKSFGKGVLVAVKHLNVFSKISEKIGPSLSRLGTMIKQAFVFGVVTKGLNYVREQMAGLMSKNEEFMAALGRLKGVLLTAFQPIYDYVMPALTTLMNGLTRALAVVAQFVAALFGKTAQQAQTSAKALNEESKSLEGTGEAAEEAAGSLAGFDEINTIQTEDKKSGGGAGDAGATDAGAPTFEYAFEDIEGKTPFESWGEAFDAFLGKVLSGVQNLKTAFGAFANNLNDYSKKVLDMFTFPGVKEKIEALGGTIAESFNGLINKVNWQQIGQAFGSGLNLALLFFSNAIYSFNWSGLGKSLAGSVNGIISQINWDSVGKLLWSGFKIGIETLAGFLLGLDVPEIAQAANNLAMSFFNSVSGTLTTVDWAGIAYKITSFVNQFDWSGVGASAGNMIVNFMNAAHTFLASVDWQGLGAGITTFINGIDWRGVGASASRLVIDFMWLISSFFAGADWAGVGASISNFINGIDWAGVARSGSNLVASFIGAVSMFLSGVDWAGLGQSITNFVNNIDWAGVSQSAGNLITTLFISLTTLISNIDFVSLATNLLDGLLAVDWLALFGSLGDLIGTTITKVLDLVFSGEVWEKMLKLGWEIIKGLWNGITNALADVGNWLNEHVFKPIINGFKKLFGIHSSSTVMSEQGKLLLDGLKQGVTDKIASVVSVFSGLWEKIKDVFSHITDWFKDKFSSAWQAVKDVFSKGGKIFDGIKDGILDCLKKVINAIIDGINKVIKVPFDGLNSALTKIKGVNIFGVKPFSWIRTINIPQIPRLAQGAVIPPNREFMAVLGDQKSGNNIEAPEDLIRKIVREESGGYSDLLRQILQAVKDGHEITVDGVTFGRTAVRSINRVNDMAGRQLLKI